MTVLSLCDATGAWSQPYVEAGYDVRRVDLANGADVRLFQALPYPVRGVLAAPPCTEFASSGARWWPGQGDLEFRMSGFRQLAASPLREDGA